MPLHLTDNLKTRSPDRTNIFQTINIYPLSEFLLEKKAEQIVGYTEPDWSPNNQHLLQPGWERPLVDEHSTSQISAFHGSMTKKTGEQIYSEKQFLGI